MQWIIEHLNIVVDVIAKPEDSHLAGDRAAAQQSKNNTAPVTATSEIAQLHEFYEPDNKEKRPLPADMTTEEY